MAFTLPERSESVARLGPASMSFPKLPSTSTKTKTILLTASCPSALRLCSPLAYSDFKICKVLGEGAISTVVLSTCTQSGCEVALKIYHREKLNSMNLRQINREIHIHAGLSHENIIKLYGAFEDADGIYLVQEYAAGGDLYGELSRHGGYMLEVHVVRHVMNPFLSALSYLHEHGILHRDIKPENILLTEHGEIKLADFGLAINTATETPSSRVGTLDYMPPEIVAQSQSTKPPHKDSLQISKSYGLPADVWCCGVLAYELLVGGPPFEADTKGATYTRILKTEPIYPAHLSAEARGFIAGALQKDPSKRPDVYQLRSSAWLHKAQMSSSAQMCYPRRLASLALLPKLKGKAPIKLEKKFTNIETSSGPQDQADFVESDLCNDLIPASYTQNSASGGPGGTRASSNEQGFHKRSQVLAAYFKKLNLGGMLKTKHGKHGHAA